MNIFLNTSSGPNFVEIIELGVIILTVVIAFIKYRNSKKKDNDSTTIDILSFFRSEVMSESEKFIEDIRDEMGSDYIVNPLRLDELNLKKFTDDQKKAIQRQGKLRSNKRASISFSTLNKLEELSLKITYFKLQNSEILLSIRKYFVIIVEMNAYYLLLARNFDENDKSYSKVLELYNLWKDNVDRRTGEEIEKDFIEMIDDKK
jgi:hypothetical protein